MGVIEGGRSCEKDDDCLKNKQYCYDVSGECVDYTKCNWYNRLEAEIPARNPSQCGPCLAGYSPEVLGTGEKRSSCTKMNATKIDMESDGSNGEMIMWTTVIVVFCFVALIAVFLSFKKRCKAGGNRKEKKRTDVSLFGPSAPPPPESSPFVGRGSQAQYSVMNNNKAENKDLNKLVSAVPCKDPAWVRTNPNYGHQSNEPAAGSFDQPLQPVAILQPEEDTNPSSWTPGQAMTVQVPLRPFAQFSNEQNDNNVNSNLEPSCSLEGVRVDSNSGGNPADGGETPDNGSRVRTSNVLISQKITMNLNVLNSDY